MARDMVLRVHLREKGKKESHMDKSYNTWHEELSKLPYLKTLVERAKSSGMVMTVKKVPRSSADKWTQGHLHASEYEPWTGSLVPGMVGYRANPPKGKFIPCKAIRFNLDGSVSYKR